MKILLLLGFLVLAVAVVAIVIKAKLVGNAATPKEGVYYLRKTLFSPAERSFLGVMETMLPKDEVRVFGKVRLEDIFGVKKGLSAGERQGARNRINRKHVDFLLVRASDLSPVAGIELDDSSHDEEDRQQRDAFVDTVFASAGLPLIHVPAQAAYTPADVRAKLAKVFD